MDPIRYLRIPWQPRAVRPCSSCATDLRADSLIWIRHPEQGDYVALCRACYVTHITDHGLHNRVSVHASRVSTGSATAARAAG